MKFWHMTLILALMITALAGCGSETPSPVVEEESVVVNTNTDESGAYVSAALDTSYEGALPVNSQLSLGTFYLEETVDAVTPEQAAALLPLWQAIQSGTLQNDTEINAVLKQIEGAMTPEQLTAIAAMQLTGEDLGAWAQEQGIALGPSPEEIATRQAEGGGQGGFGGAGDLSEEERAAMRATRQAGGAGGGFGDMSEEEQAARRATAEASGMNFGNRKFGGGAGQFNVVIAPLIELLTQRAAE